MSTLTPYVNITPSGVPFRDVTVEAVHEQAVEYALEARDMRVYYGDTLAVTNVNLAIHPRKITAIIGPSGCGKSTLLRAFNRMNDLIPGARVTGEVLFRGRNLYDPRVDPVEVRRRIGMVFQKPNPFPKSIYENIAFGLRINGWRGSKQEMDEQVERAL